MIIVDRNGIYRDTSKIGCDRLSCLIQFEHTHADLLAVQIRPDS